jgi:hypothetical protein
MSGPERERGSILPLILGLFLVALTMVAGTVSFAQSFVQQQGLQDVCDGAAAAAASAANLDRDAALGAGPSLRFDEVQQVVAGYLARDAGRADVHSAVALSADARQLRLTCTETLPVVFGAMFGKGDGVRHTVHSAARAPLT